MLTIHCSQAHYSHSSCVAQQANEVVIDKGMKHVNPNLGRQKSTFSIQGRLYYDPCAFMERITMSGVGFKWLKSKFRVGGLKLNLGI
jgi:hypothetical protein